MLVFPILFVALVLFTGGVALAVTERRRGIARTVVRQMAMVTSQNLPLGTGLMLAGRGERGKAGRILQRVADLVSQGVPLGEAVVQGYPNCPGLIVSVIQAAQQVGRLAGALRMLSRDLDRHERRRSKIMPLAIIYALFLLFVLLIVWTSIMIVIVPKFKEIFSDFGAKLPGVTVFAMQLSEDVANRILIPVAVFWLVLAIPFGLYRLFRPRASGRSKGRDTVVILLRVVVVLMLLVLVGMVSSPISVLSRTGWNPTILLASPPGDFARLDPLVTLAVLVVVLALVVGFNRIVWYRSGYPPELLSRIVQQIRRVRIQGVAAAFLCVVILMELAVLFMIVGLFLFRPAGLAMSLTDIRRHGVECVVEMPWVPLGIVGFFLAIPLSLHWVFRSRRPARPFTASVIADGVRWRMPGLGRMQMAEGMATFASLLRLFVGAGMPLGRAAALAGEADMNAVLRQRVRRFAEMIDLGTPPPMAADQAGLGMILATALRSGQVGDRLDASLRFAADYYRSIVSRFWIVLRTIMWPVLTLIMAVLVGTFVAAMFLPLVALINAVLETV